MSPNTGRCLICGSARDRYESPLGEPECLSCHISQEVRAGLLYSRAEMRRELLRFGYHRRRFLLPGSHRRYLGCVKTRKG